VVCQAAVNHHQVPHTAGNLGVRGGGQVGGGGQRVSGMHALDEASSM
jgi:hypothetical protein